LATDILQVHQFGNCRVQVDPVAAFGPDVREAEVLQQVAEIPEGDVLNVSTRHAGEQLAGLHQARSLKARVAAHGSSLPTMITGEV